MNYALTSKRRIGKRVQNIVSTQVNAPKSSAGDYFRNLKAWHEAFTALDPSGRNVGVIEYKGFSEFPSQNLNNVGYSCDGILNVVSEINGMPELVTVRFEDATVETIAEVIDTEYYRVTGRHINTTNQYIVSAMLTIY